MTDALSGLLTYLGVVVSAAGFAVLLTYPDSDEWRKRPWFKPALFIAAFAWLWFPWIGFGVYQIAKANMNAIDYRARPPAVIPLKPETIDLNKPEVKQ